MRVIERTIEHPKDEGVILEYVNWTKDFAEIKEYVKRKYQLCLLFPAICTCVNLYASLYPNLSEGRYDCKADITAKRNRTCGIGSRNVSYHPFCDG